MAAEEVATAVATAVAAATEIHLVEEDIPPGGNPLHSTTHGGVGTNTESGSHQPFACRLSPAFPSHHHGIVSLATQLLRLSTQFLTRMAFTPPVIQ